MKTDISRLLEEEIAALEDPIRKSVDEMERFWGDENGTGLAVLAGYPYPEGLMEPTDCSVTERELYNQLMLHVKPAIESRKIGAVGAPMLYPHEGYYDGPKFGTHFLAAVLGAEVFYPKDTEKTGWYSWVKPLIEDKSQFGILEEIDVSKSPIMQALNRGLVETMEIVKGRIPITNYAPTFVLDFAAEVIGHVKFYEMTAEDPEAAAKLLDICLDKWIEIRDLQEKAAGVRMENYSFIPGIRISDMILPYFSPDDIRKIILPYNIKMAEYYGACAVGINHKEIDLIDDYKKIPGLKGFSVPIEWPIEKVMEKIGPEYVIQGSFSWHYHTGKTPHSPICVNWDDCRLWTEKIAGRRRAIITISCVGDTYDERLANVIRDVGDIIGTWDRSANNK